ncbi:biotin--[acetyl-CoA-carboxylase] ligase [Odoribacter lunatus]|uniref:biotin--[acetyl-CoA-carboxylase] ligase n=1 Tax=Odoribacter lunatus TaxID=2941335 RepID=UPI00203CF66A|nr:biotin--[acetyl-CoA-carboxylase] ligase [Odoribacter lunatus]
MIKKYNVSGFEVWEYGALTSTNTEAEQWKREELKDKRVVLTYRQMSGRGQATNRWESEPNKNIAVTVVLCPPCYEASRQFAVSMVCALGVYDFVSKYVEGVSVKWPNDVYVGDKKICGILIEHTVAGRFIRSSLCGIGVNINQTVFLSDAPNPVSLFQLTGKEIPLDKAVEELLACIGKRYGRIEEYEVLERDFMECLYRRQGIYRWEDEEGEFEASVVRIDEFGRLVLKDTEGTLRVYGFKEVAYK